MPSFFTITGGFVESDVDSVSLCSLIPVVPYDSLVHFWVRVGARHHAERDKRVSFCGAVGVVRIHLPIAQALD